MQDDVSRLLGIEGMVVRGVIEVGRKLELEVELVTRAACCRWCGRSSLTVKDRPVVRVRDLPLAGRSTILRWRKRRFRCEGCERTFTETHPQLPPRQRVSARFRARLFERCRGGGAHAEVAREERTTRYQVARAFKVGSDELQARRDRRPPRRLSLDEAAHRRGHELATVVSDLDRRRVVMSSTAAADASFSAICSDSLKLIVARSRSSRSIHTTPTAKRSGPSCRGRGSSSITSTSSAARTPPWTQSGANASDRHAPAARREPGRAARPVGARTSFTPATDCSRHATGSPPISAGSSASSSRTSR